MDNVLGLEKMTVYKIQKMGVGTLIRLPSPVASPAFPFTAYLFGAMRTILLLHARGLVVASFSRHSETRTDAFAAAEKVKEAC
jgi:hypothetical protein